MKKFKFPGQKEDEEIIAVFKKHPFTLFWPLLKPSILVIFILYFFINFSYSNPILFLILFIGFLISIGWGFYLWICWTLDIYIITDQRIIDMERKGLFSKRVAEASYDKIQDISYEIKGFFPTLFNFGDILIQTAGAVESVKLDQVANPPEICNLIRDIQKDPEKFKPGSFSKIGFIKS